MSPWKALLAVTLLQSRVLQWIKQHSQYVNQVPAGATQSAVALGGLDPQECFNEALETVAALKPVQEGKKYTTAELQRIWAACSLCLLTGRGANKARDQVSTCASTVAPR
jgi:hypothetical protein